MKRYSKVEKPMGDHFYIQRKSGPYQDWMSEKFIGREDALKAIAKKGFFETAFMTSTFRNSNGDQIMLRHFLAQRGEVGFDVVRLWEKSEKRSLEV